MGKVAKAFIEEVITLDDLKSLNYSLDLIDLRMADYLKETSESISTTNNPQDQMLAQCGLMSLGLSMKTITHKTLSMGDDGPEEPGSFETFKSASILYKVTDLGKLFVDICLT